MVENKKTKSLLQNLNAIANTTTMTNRKYNIQKNIRASILLVFFIIMGTFQISAQIYNSSTTYTVPAETTSIKVHAWGGGGGGGTRSINGATGGGGAGAYSYAEIPVSPGQQVVISVGNGGSAGSTGGDTQVTINGTTHLLAKGGAGVSNNTTSGGSGGQASQGTGTTRTNGGNGSNSSGNTAGNGGNSPNGGSGGIGTNSNENGAAGDAPGGGGAGARRSSGTRTGGSGGNGRVVIDYSYWGSGSRDLYQQLAVGGRAYLRASETESAAFPFPTLGTHYVYAAAGEQIALASNAQSGTNKRIYLYRPDGTDVTPAISSGDGNIANRNAEVAGPQLPGQGSGNNRYKPIFYTVPGGQSGIYKVEFRGTNNNTSGDDRLTYSSASTWPQSTSNSNYLVAWDISVAKQTGGTWNWVPGRLYTQVLNMDNPSYGGANGLDNSEFRPNSGFYGKFIAATRDGFAYNVDNNGSQGISFTFMVNNKGFHIENNPNRPSYKSIAASSATSVTSRYQDPRTVDGNGTFTQKIFYTIPDSNMPVRSTGNVPGDETWLNVAQPELDVTRAVFQGTEGATDWTAGNKGGYFVFDSGRDVEYHIIISSPTNAFSTRELIGYTEEDGENRVFWDAKDGDGVPLPSGTSPASVQLQLQGAEVHFPYIDMELNHNGIKLQLLNSQRTEFISDKVYWNDEDLENGGGNNGTKSNPQNASHFAIPEGTSSTINGHIWGIGSNATASTFGDNMGMDTWTFAKGSTFTREFAVSIKKADLEVTQLTADTSGNLFLGSEITYTIKVINHGDADFDFSVENAPFNFVVPKGFVPIDGNFFQFDGNTCDGEEVPGQELVFDAVTNTFKSELNLPKGCEITYTITVKVNGEANAGMDMVKAGIMRPDDVQDPDATNLSDPENPLGDWEVEIDLDEYFYPPFNPFFEAENNGLTSSNNVRNLPTTIIKVNAKDDINQTSFRTSVGGNLLTNDTKMDKISELSFNGIAFPVDTATTLIKDGITYGTINAQEDGSYIFHPAATFFGEVPPINYIATNLEGGVHDSANLYITVAGPYFEDENNPPIAQNDVYTTTEGIGLTSDVLNNDSDPDDGDNLTVTSIHQGNSIIPVGVPTTVSGVTVLGDPVVNAGTVTIGANGVITFLPEENFIGEIDALTYEIEDGQGSSDSANVFISVIPNGDVNLTFANDDANAAPKGETMVGNLLKNDFDPEDDDQTVSSATVTSAAGNLITVNLILGTSNTISGVGELTVYSNGDYTFVPTPDFVGTLVVAQTVCDNGTPQACDDATLYLTCIDMEKKQALLITNPMVRQRIK